ncbi:MAG TPA: hypothetical protein VJ723_07260 [Candidatus Angelobacter sp.]|nr:hypothetical protein [Candidatus Angelobacter sp.]
MASLDTNAEAESHLSSRLPLFRPEALAAQQKLNGEILLIRPFSLLCLGWLGTGIAAVVFGYLLLGHYTEKARVPAFLAPYREVALSSPGSQRAAVFYFPARWRRSMQPGEPMTVYCQSCPDPAQRLTGTVMEVTAAPPATERAARPGAAPDAIYKVTMALPPQLSPFINSNFVPPDLGLWVEVPLGEKPLIHWLFEQPAK